MIIITIADIVSKYHMEIIPTLQALLDCEEPSPQLIADTLLEEAVRLDQNRPVDDISVVALRIIPLAGDNVRRMTVRLPINVV